MPQYIPFVFLSILALWGAWTDLRTRRISNLLVILTVIFGLLFPALEGNWDAVLMHLAHFSVALVIGLALFAAKFWGGGDGKLYAAIAAWFPIEQFFFLVFAISAVGLVLVLVIVARNGGRLMARSASSVPYGVAIGLGGIVNFSRVLW